MPEQKPENIRRTVYFTGHVQGVGFRYTACEVARSFSVAGTVKNLPDGRVEMVAEGDTGEVSRFQEAVADAMGGRITDVAGQVNTGKLVCPCSSDRRTTGGMVKRSAAMNSYRRHPACIVIVARAAQKPSPQTTVRCNARI